MSPLQNNNIGFVFVVYFAIQVGVFLREMFELTFALRKIKKLKNKTPLKNMTFCCDLSYDRLVREVLQD